MPYTDNRLLLVLNKDNINMFVLIHALDNGVEAVNYMDLHFKYPRTYYLSFNDYILHL